jgi:hypothetical protein
MRYLLLQEFQSNVFAPGRTSFETSSPDSIVLFPFTDFDTEGDSPLGLDDHPSLDNFFKDSQDMNDDQCLTIAQKYQFWTMLRFIGPSTTRYAKAWPQRLSTKLLVD